MDESTTSPPSWPPPNGLTSIIVPRSSTILSMHGSAHISAPASLVFSIILDTSTYPTWNTFCPRVTIHSQPRNVPSDAQQILHKDTSLTFHVVMDASKPHSVTDISLRVTDVSTPEAQSGYVPKEVLEGDGTFERDLARVYSVAWTAEGSFLWRGLKCERWHEIREISERECEVRTWECQGGVLARVVKYMFKDVLQRKFQNWCVELKREAEKRFSESND